MEPRKAGYIETLFHYLHTPIKGNHSVVSLAKVKGKIKRDIFKRALEALFNRHPLLRSSLIEDREALWIKPCLKFSQISITFQELDASKEDIISSMHSEIFPLGSPLWKVRIYTKGDENWLFFHCHHSICDGLAALYWIDTLIDAYERIEKNPFGKTESLPLLPPIEELLHRNVAFSDFQKSIHSQESEMIYPYAEYVGANKRTSKVDFFSFSTEEIEPFHQKAKDNEVTFNMLLSAAVALAFAQLNLTKKTVVVLNAINERTQCNPPISFDHFGAFFSSITSRLTNISKETGLIDIAKLYQSQFEGNLKRYGYKPIVNNVPLSQLFKHFDELFPIQEGFDVGPCLTNCGKVPFSMKRINHRIEEIYTSTACLGENIPFLVHMNSVDDRFFFTISHVSPLVSESDARLFKEAFFRILHQSC